MPAWGTPAALHTQALLPLGVGPGPVTCSTLQGCRRFSGDPVIPDPDVAQLALTEDDEFVVLATDGLWDMMDSQAVVRLVREQLSKGLDSVHSRLTYAKPCIAYRT